jgi:hypothetical protein
LTRVGAAALQSGHETGGNEVTEKNPWRFGPTRGELWFWLWASIFGLALMVVALVLRGIPEGPAFFEVVGLATLVFGYLGGRSIKRLIRREHP